jgi:hypothetical protein
MWDLLENLTFEKVKFVSLGCICGISIDPAIV